MGSNDKDAPNQFYGVAVKVEKGSSNITILNAHIHGYKIAILADSVNGLHIYNSDCSYNYRQQLHSTWQREDVSDWMSYHHNEHDEWMRYGAGIYLNNCNSAVIKGNTITNGQCGLMMVRCNYAEVYNNDFCYNSGLGIGMYRSSNNQVHNNILDFNVRGYSNGVFNRGQDSAGILVFEQCNNNVFAYNSVTHGGDGFFLWAGQYTMDNGKGGCNDNLIIGNNFSYAPTNGVEVTFSRNDILRNTIAECDNGIWGGYSYNSMIEQNNLENNKTAIAIEHGQQITVYGNIFTHNKTGVLLWGSDLQPSDWVYPKMKDTRSRDYNINENQFTNNNTAISVTKSINIHLVNNKWDSNYVLLKQDTSARNIDTVKVGLFNDRDPYNRIIKFMPPGAVNSAKALGKNKQNILPHAGRNQIRVTEWGPYNFNYPLVFLQKVDSAGLYHFEVLHPGGNLRLAKLNGFTIIQQTHDSIIAKADSAVTNRYVQMQYTGPAFTDAFGKPHAANRPYLFSYNEFDVHPQWNINFYKWDAAHAADKNYNVFVQSLQTPVFTTTANKIDYTWWGAIGKGMPADSFATVATCTMDLPDNRYEISITGDDLVKLYIDDKPVIDAWDATLVNLDENTNHTVRLPLSGRHSFKIVHAEIGGLATLMFYLKPVEVNKATGIN